MWKRGGTESRPVEKEAQIFLDLKAKRKEQVSHSVATNYICLLPFKNGQRF